MTLPKTLLFIILFSASGLLTAQVNLGDQNNKKENLEPEGPANRPIDIFQHIESDYAFNNDYFDVLNVASQIFEDINPQSGYYYYFPKEYQLSWSPFQGIPEEGYAFNVNYLAADAMGGRSSVVALKLKPNVSREDIHLAEQLVRNNIKNKPGRTFRQLQSIPLAEPPRISLQGLEDIIAPSDVEVSVPSDFLDPIVLLLKVEQPENLLLLLFNDVPLQGRLTIAPDGDVPVQEIRVEMKLDYHKTFGTFEVRPAVLRNREEWKNPTPYPIVLKNMHLLRIERRGQQYVPAIYTWEMGNKEVPEGGKVNFDASTMPTWLDSDRSVKKIWMEYAVKKCFDCNKRVEEELREAADGPTMARITFDVVDPLNFTGASKMRIKVRSNQLDPNGRKKIELNPSLVVLNDGATLENVSLFVPQGSKPQFDYLISLTMPDGQIIQSGWISNRGASDIGIGRAIIRNQFPEFANK